MLNIVNDYLDYRMENWLNIDNMNEDERKLYRARSLSKYLDAKEAVKKCISKYALLIELVYMM